MPASRPLGPSATASTSGGPGSEVKMTSHLLGQRLRAVGPDRAGGEMALGRGAADVVDDELVPRLLQVRRHAGTHRAEPDETDLHVISPRVPHLSLSPHAGEGTRLARARLDIDVFRHAARPGSLSRVRGEGGVRGRRSGFFANTSLAI